VDNRIEGGGCIFVASVRTDSDVDTESSCTILCTLLSSLITLETHYMVVDSADDRGERIVQNQYWIDPLIHFYL
jgi:hypothetical protein